MKKYMIPSMSVVELTPITLLAGSENNLSTTLSDDTPAGTTFHSRDFHVWGVDEEDD